MNGTNDEIMENAGNLNEDDLQALFRETSTFSVKSLSNAAHNTKSLREVEEQEDVADLMADFSEDENQYEFFVIILFFFFF